MTPAEELDPTDAKWLCKVIEKARELLGPNGEHWGQGAFYWDVGGVIDDMEVERTGSDYTPTTFCLVGAIRYASFLLEPDVDMVEATVSLFSRFVELPEGQPEGEVVAFNDAPGQGFPAIATALDETREQVCAAASPTS
jgi:hypothetical protein